jgi:hypothetical protein
MSKFNRFFLFFLIITFFLKLSFILIYLGPFPTPLAPDESTYSSLIYWVSQGNPPKTFPLIDGDLFITSMTTSVPSTLLVKLGLNPLFSARLVSIIYSIFSIYILYRILWYLLKESIFESQLKVKDRKLLFITIFIFTYFPSSFLWSTLALRESANYLFLLLTFYTFMMYLQRFEVKYLIMFAASLTLLYFTRPEILLIISLSFLPLILKIKKNILYCILSLLPILIYIISSRAEVILYQKSDLFLSNPMTDFKNELIISQKKVGVRVNNLINGLITSNSDVINNNSEVINEKHNLTINITEEFNKITMELDNLRINKRKGAETAFPLYQCPKYKINLFDGLNICPFYNLPKQLIDVIIYPVKISPQQSWNKNLAALENAIFNTYLLACIVLFPWKKRFKDSIKITFNIYMSFIFVTLVTFAFVEGNYGTSYRHKMIVLGPILVLLFTTMNNFRNRVKKF